MPGELAKAVCSVMRSVRAVPETGYNKHGGYKYASDSDLLGAIQPAMAEAGLALIPRSVASTTVAHGESKAGNAKWRTDLVVTYALLHVSGEEAQVEAPGCGIDGDDKGVYKAMTGALKYALRHLFLVPTGEDAEREARRDPDPRQEQRRDPEPQPNGNGRSEQRSAVSSWDPATWEPRLVAAGLSLDEAIWWCAEKTESRKHPKDLDDATRTRAIGWLASPQGVEAVRAAVHEVREELRRCFFGKWTTEFPELRKKDGVSDEDIERASTNSEANRRIVLKNWYGVDSLKTIPIRAALKGPFCVEWLRKVDQKDFAGAIDDALGEGTAP